MPPSSARSGATAHRRRRRRGAGPGRRAARSRSHVAADERLLDADVRCTLGHREGVLAGLAATAAHLIPAEVGGDVIDAVERLEQIPREHDVFHQLRHPPVAEYAAVKEKFSSIVWPPNAPHA